MTTSPLPAAVANLVKPKRWIPVTETAKLIRQALKEAFPEVKFGVTSKKYSGGSSISVHWNDGPLTKQVEAIAGAFQGGSFDGMTDCKSYRSHTLNGEPVHFGGDFVFCNRRMSAHTEANLLAALVPMSAEDKQQLAYHYELAGHYRPEWDNDARLAWLIFANRPAPAYEGRRSKLADSVTNIDSD